MTAIKPGLIALLFVATTVHAQKIPQDKLDRFFHEAYQKVNNHTVHQENLPTDGGFTSGALQNIKKYKEIKPFQSRQSRSGDTLFVGIPPIDSLTITGNFFHDGPIFVYGNGVLRFKNANATILGDLWVWGDKAQVTADSSTLYFPQQYFYQRSLVVAGNGSVIYRNTTLDHGGLSHNLVLIDSAYVEMRNVKNIGFTTWGLYSMPEIYIDGINEAGEFVITDSSRLTFKNAKTILLWHHFPKNSVVNYAFPKGDTVHSYVFNSATPGISGVDYRIDVKNSYNIMWGMMPTTNSDVTISDSKIRAIGLWFEGSYAIDVNGLVNNSNYTDFTSSLTDRKIRLINTFVQTWSLYAMDNTKLNVTGCILGEIGTQNSAQLQSSQIYVDGSGGYWWTTDTSFMIAGFSSAVNDIRSSRNSIFLFAYSTLNNGVASALDNSIFMIVQSQLPDEPKLFDKSAVWYAYVGKPSSSYVDTIVPVYGSAWIDKGAGSPLMDFAYYSMYYQKQGDTGWHAIAERVKTEKRDEVLADFNTHNLQPGQYIIKMVLCDNTVDSNKLEAMKAINLLPGILVSVDDKARSGIDFEIYPNPFTGSVKLNFKTSQNSDVSVRITDAMGKVVYERNYLQGTCNSPVEIDGSKWAKGLYFCHIRFGDQIDTKKFVKVSLTE
jgi:hypothetical protein